MTRAVPLLLVALLLSPVAAGAWRAPGAQEPDTPQDLQHGSMWRDATDKPGRVYFHGFVAAEGTSLNPNVGILGTRFQTPGAVHHRAILGVWRDCNADGYIGLAEGAVQDYHATLLLDARICPPQPDANEPVHNDGLWVSEMLTIGMVDPCEFEHDSIRTSECPGVDAFALNERVHYANGTSVWADLGLPGAPPRPECVLAPLPRGTTTSTGAMIGYADCQSARGIAQAVNTVDADGEAGLRFEDTSRPQDSSSHLNQPLPVRIFGAPGSTGLLQEGAPASATVWDCSRPRAIAIAAPEPAREVAASDPTGVLAADTFPMVIVHALTGVGFVDEDDDDATPGVLRVRATDADGNLLWLPAPAPSLDDPTASSWATLAHAADGPNGDCDPSTRSAADGAYPGRAVESDATPILEARKARTSFAFTFFDGHRGIHPRIDPTLGPGTPSDGGLFVGDHDRTGDGPLWSATAATDQDPQLLDRRDLRPAGALHVTYYASIGADALAKGLVLANGGSTSRYGSEACGSFTTGVHGGWVCDASLWWKDDFGEDVRPHYAQGTVPFGRVVGESYHLRDVDCYDGSIAQGTGVQASLVLLTEEGGCAEAP